MASVFKRGRDKQRRGSSWYISYDDENGKRRTRKGFTDKRATEQLALEIEHDLRRKKAGLIDPDEQRRQEARLCPIAELTDGYRRSISHNAPKYVKLTMSRLTTVVEGMGMRTLGTASAEGLRRFLDKFRTEQDLGNRTYNHYLQTMDGFGNWLVATKRVVVNPFAGITRLNTEVDVRHPRRALSVEEFAQLIESARTSQETIQTFDGEQRSRIYLLSYFTGLRRKELGSLTPANFDLEAATPTVTVEAACSKHKKKDVLPLHPELAGMCRSWIANLESAEFLFPGLGKKKTWTMVRKDLERAGIPYQTKEGIADFHAAGRHSHITELIRSGASLAETRELARHSDIRMTMKYVHIGLADQAKAVSKLPWNKAHEQPHNIESMPKDWQRPDSGTCHTTGQSLSSADTPRHTSEDVVEVQNPSKNRGSDAACRDESSPFNEDDEAAEAGIEPANTRFKAAYFYQQKLPRSESRQRN